MYKLSYRNATYFIIIYLLQLKNYGLYISFCILLYDGFSKLCIGIYYIIEKHTYFATVETVKEENQNTL